MFNALKFEHVIERALENFQGRKWFVDPFEKWKRSTETKFPHVPDGKSVLLVKGRRGTGKTALCARLTRVVDLCVAHHFCASEDAMTLRAGTFVSSVSAQMCHEEEALANVVYDAESEYTHRLKQEDMLLAWEEGVLDPLAEVEDGVFHKKVFVVDGLGRAVRSDSHTTIVDVLAHAVAHHKFPPWLLVVCSIDSDHPQCGEIAERLQAHVIDLDAVEQRRKDAHTYVHSMLSAMSESVQGVSSDAALIDQLIDRVDGNYLAASLVFDLVRFQASAELADASSVLTPGAVGAGGPGGAGGMSLPLPSPRGRPGSAPLPSPRGRPGSAPLPSPRGRPGSAAGAAGGDGDGDGTARKMSKKSSLPSMKDVRVAEPLPRAKYKAAVDILREVPTGDLQEVLLFVFQRMFPTQASFSHARRLLTVLLAAYEPLPMRAVCEATGLDPVRDLRPVLSRVHNVVFEVNDDGRRELHYTLAHDCIGEFLRSDVAKNNTPSFFCDPAEGHRLLAEYGWAASHLTVYMARYLIHHLMRGGVEPNCHRAASLLFQMEFLRQKINKTNVLALCNDFALLREMVPAAGLVLDALRDATPALLKNKMGLERELELRLRHTRERRVQRLLGVLHHRRASQSMVRAMRFGDTEGVDSLAAKEPHHGALRCVASVRAANGRDLIATGGYDSKVHVLERETLTSVKVLGKRAVNRHSGFVTCVRFLPGGKRIATGAYDEMIKVWSLTSDRVVTLRGHSGAVLCLWACADGKTLVSGSRDRTVRVWNVDKKQSTACLSHHTNRVHAVRTNAASTLLFTAGEDRTVYIIDMLRLTKLHMVFTESPVLTLALSADEARLFAGTVDNSVTQWDIESGKALQRARGLPVRVNAMVIDAVQGVAAGAVVREEVVRVWALDTGREVCSYHHHDATIMCMAHVGDNVMLTGDEMGHLHMWQGERQHVRQLSISASAASSRSGTPAGSRAGSRAGSCAASPSSSPLPASSPPAGPRRSPPATPPVGTPGGASSGEGIVVERMSESPLSSEPASPAFERLVEGERHLDRRSSFLHDAKVAAMRATLLGDTGFEPDPGAPVINELRGPVLKRAWYRGAWVSRYAIVADGVLVLREPADSTMHTECGRVPLVGVVLRQGLPSDEALGKSGQAATRASRVPPPRSHPFTFTIQAQDNPRHVYVFACEHEEDYSRWMRALHANITRAKLGQAWEYALHATVDAWRISTERNGSRYAEYSLRVSDGFGEWVTMRRYSQFRQLRKDMNSVRAVAVKIPSRTLFSSVKESVVVERLNKLGPFVQSLLREPWLPTAMLKLFLSD